MWRLPLLAWVMRRVMRGGRWNDGVASPSVPAVAGAGLLRQLRGRLRVVRPGAVSVTGWAVVPWVAAFVALGFLMDYVSDVLERER